ncbi:DUF6291 domain-containing protein [Prevotellamassilia timonensis]|uniref:DUF7833 domain-containing protein n=1 Tax=Prevotellamassilia timonensis TaxID=1852370 RepID=UPI003A93688B
MARDSFVFYRSFFEAISLMPPEVQAEVYPALVEYALNGKESKGLSDIAQGVFILVKPNIDASITRIENGKKFGKLGGRPTKKGNTASSAKLKADIPTPPTTYTLTLQQEIEQMKTDHTWNEPVCMQFHISADELAKRLDTFHNHCKCENDGKAHSNINDAKRHFCSWMRKAYTQVEHDSDTELPPPSYEFNGGFGGQDI